MTSTKMKIAIPILIIGIIVFWSGMNNYSGLKISETQIDEMQTKYYSTVLKSDDLKLSVIQVQQWLTDISVTRAAEGLDDGFDEAKSHAEIVRNTIEELKEINPDDEEELEQMLSYFKVYYETGIEMANRYINDGTESGNEYMGIFDESAANINTSVDEYSKKASENIDLVINNIKNEFTKQIIINIITIVLIILIFIGALKYYEKAIITPINNVLGKLRDMVYNSGDLTQKIEYKSNDEIGLLALNFNYMQDLYREIISEVRNEVEILIENSAKSQEISQFVDTKIAEINDVIANLSGGMQENASAAEEVNSSSTFVNEEINSIAIYAEEEKQNAFEIQERASTLKKSILDSQKAIVEINKSSKIELKEAIEKSKEVEKIGMLSDSILNFAEQTNLLSLNAAIEAARAGEAGRGFSIVADEISKLAYESSISANEIKEVSNSIVENVSRLIDTSNGMLEFIDTRIMSDYEFMVDTGNKYSNDAQRINNMTTVFSNRSHKAQVSMNDITCSISGIAENTNAATKGNSDIEEKIQIINDKTNILLTMSNDVAERCNSLNKLVSGYKV